MILIQYCHDEIDRKHFKDLFDKISITNEIVHERELGRLMWHPRLVQSYNLTLKNCGRKE